MLKAWSSSGGDKQTAQEDGKAASIASVMKYYEELRAKNEAAAERRAGLPQIPRIRGIEEEIPGHRAPDFQGDAVGCGGRKIQNPGP